MLLRHVRLTMGWLSAVTLGLGLGACSSDPTPAPNPLPPVSGTELVKLEVVSQPESGVINSELVDPVIVKATNQAGEPLSGLVISFSLLSGGTIENSSATTDADGEASPGAWTLGSVARTQRLVASAGGTTIGIDVAVATAPGNFTTLVGPAGLAGGAFTAGLAPSVGTKFVAIDDAGNRIGAGTRIRFRAIEGTLPAADSAINTNAGSEVTPRWTLSSIFGEQRLERRYTVNNVLVVDTIRVTAVCTRTALGTSAETVEGQWRSSDCRSATQRLDEYTFAYTAQTARTFGINAGGSPFLRLRSASGTYLQNTVPAYIANAAPFAVTYVAPAAFGGIFEAWAADLSDVAYQLTASGSGANGIDDYFPAVGCGQAGNPVTFVFRGIDGFNYHRPDNACTGGGFGTYQDRYLITLAANDSIRVNVRHGTAGTPTPQFTLNLRDASSAAGLVVRTATPPPATATGPTATGWVLGYRTPVAGLFEIIIGTGTADNMDYRLILQ